MGGSGRNRTAGNMGLLQLCILALFCLAIEMGLPARSAVGIDRPLSDCSSAHSSASLHFRIQCEAVVRRRRQALGSMLSHEMAQPHTSRTFSVGVTGSATSGLAMSSTGTPQREPACLASARITPVDMTTKASSMHSKFAPAPSTFLQQKLHIPTRAGLSRLRSAVFQNSARTMVAPTGSGTPLLARGVGLSPRQTLLERRRLERMRPRQQPRGLPWARTSRSRFVRCGAVATCGTIGSSFSMKGGSPPWPLGS